MSEKGLWKSDSQHSSAEFSVRHMMVATVRGRFRNVNVEFSGDPGVLEDGKVKVDIDTGSVDTFNTDRDTHLKSDDFFNAEKFPKMVFEGTGIKKIAEDEYEVSGNLTIRDITKEAKVKLESTGSIKDPYGNERMGFSATGQVVREDFGLKWNTPLDNGGVLVGSKVKFTVDGELVLQTGS